MSGSTEAWNRRRALQGREREERRAKFLSGKRCDWCGSSSGLVVAARAPLPPYISQMKEASAKLLRERIDAGEYSEVELLLERCPHCGGTSFARRKRKSPALKCRNCRAEFDSPERRTVKTGRVSPEQWKSFWEKYSDQIKERLMAERSEAQAKCRSLADCIVLCKRCHFARQKGMTLCPSCGKGYRRASYDLCWECFKKTEEGKEVAKRYELVAYEHPWCQKKFGLERRFLELLNEPEVCCRELCKDLASCRIAEGHGAGRAP